MTETIVDLIENFPAFDGTAVVHNGDRIAYDELYDDIASIAARLSEMNVSTRSDTGPSKEAVAVLGENTYDLLVGTYGVIYSGAIAVPIDEQLPADSIERIIDVTDVARVLVDDVDRGIETDADVVSIATATAGESTFHPPEPTEQDTALILFTSGTTGKKKGVKLSHRNLIETSKYINEFMHVDEAITEHILVPIHHSFGFARTRCVFLHGGTIVLDDGDFNPLLAFKRLENYECDAFSGVPSVIEMLHQAGENRFSRIRDHIRHVEIGSAPMSAERKRTLRETLPDARICMHYGLTEASRACFLDFSKDNGKLDSVGKSSPGVSVRIVDEDGNEVPTGETGEIAIRGPNVAEGYLEASTDSQTNSDIGEWFHSGDAGYVDTDGYVYFEGRTDNIINVGGEKISPTEIEHSIAESEIQPGEYCVIGVEDVDDIYSEAPVLCTTDESFTERRLKELHTELHARGIKEIFYPRDVLQVDEIPTTHNGKVQRNKIPRAEFGTGQ